MTEQRATPVREARLGRPAGPVGTAPHAVVLVLPGGGETSSLRRQRAAPAWTARTLARRLVRGAEPLLAHPVRLRCRGWGEEGLPVQDARWAVEEVGRRYGDVPVCLAGVDTGARAALQAAGHPAVASVLALGPRLPESGEPEPVRQLLGRKVLIAHGTEDQRTEPELSYRLAERAKKVNADVCRFEVHSDGHALRQHRFEVTALARDFVRGTLCDLDFARPLADAMAAPPPIGLRMPLASGFGRSLRL
nr:alpha/beta hydrolase [Streptomyces xiaopingdaonensis]